jgi:hypothetical protein
MHCVLGHRDVALMPENAGFIATANQLNNNIISHRGTGITEIISL